jgi:hypothetical protein
MLLFCSSNISFSHTKYQKDLVFVLMQFVIATKLPIGVECKKNIVNSEFSKLFQVQVRGLPSPGGRKTLA